MARKLFFGWYMVGENTLTCLHACLPACMHAPTHACMQARTRMQLYGQSSSPFDFGAHSQCPGPLALDATFSVWPTHVVSHAACPILFSIARSSSSPFVFGWLTPCMSQSSGLAHLMSSPFVEGLHAPCAVVWGWDGISTSNQDLKGDIFSI